MAVLDATEDDINGLNLYVYCYNNPVNDRDDCGDLSWWKKLLIGVAVIVAVVAVAAIVVATGGAGSAVAAVAIGAAKGAIVGAAVGAAQGAVIGGVTGYIEGGSAGILSGMVEGAADGFMIGAISGAVTGGIAGGKAFKSPNKALYNTSSSKVKAPSKITDKSIAKSNAMKEAHNFDGVAKVSKLKRNRTVYRTYGGESVKDGQWFSPKKYDNVDQMLALYPGNTREFTSKFVIKRGTYIVKGRVKPQFGKTGGGIQWFVGNIKNIFG